MAHSLQFCLSLQQQIQCFVNVFHFVKHKQKALCSLQLSLSCFFFFPLNDLITEASRLYFPILWSKLNHTTCRSYETRLASDCDIAILCSDLSASTLKHLKSPKAVFFFPFLSINSYLSLYFHGFVVEVRHFIVKSY